jgi:excisionase family DNA binding protein
MEKPKQVSEFAFSQRAMTITDFCRRYRIGRTKTYEEIKSQRLRAVKCGKRTLVIQDDAETWLLSLPTVADVRAAS